MDDFNEDEGIYSLNFPKIVESKEFLSTTRLLAAKMMVNPYITVGDFLKSLSDDDLRVLMHRADIVDEGNNGGDFILLSEMLATGEGLNSSEDADEVTKRVNSFIMYLTIESLYRKGMVEIFRENFSFGEDAGDKVIVKPIESED